MSNRSQRDFFEDAVGELAATDAAPKPFRAARLSPRRSWFYAISAGVFCAGLCTIAVAFGDSRFIAKATIVSTEDSALRHVDLPLSTKVQEDILRDVVAKEGLASDTEFAARQIDWMTRIGLVFRWTDLKVNLDTSRDKALATLEQSVAIRSAMPPDRLDYTGLGISRTDATSPASFDALSHPALEIDVSSRDAGKAARIATAIAQAIVDREKAIADAREMKRQAAADEAANFASRLQMAKQRLADFRVAQDQGISTASSVEGEQIVSLADAKADVDHIARALASGKTSSLANLHFKTPELDRLSVQYAELQQRLQQSKMTLGEKHPELIVLENQLQVLSQNLHREWLKTADIANRTYRSAQLRGAHADGVPAVAVSKFADPEIRQLQSDIDVASRDYQHALALQAKADAAFDRQTAWSVSPASVPASPTRKPPGLIAGAALMLGAMFGVGRILVESKRGPHQRPLKQSAARIFPVPRIKRSWFSSSLKLKPELDVACREVLDQPQSEFSRAMEDLYAFETQTRSRGMVKTLCVSQDDGLGTTTVAVNLAHAAAKAGDRVLLIEANRRNPVLASLLSPNVKVDLIDLMGELRIICHLRQGLSVIPLVGEEEIDVLAERAQRCMKGLKKHFDFVIIDGGTYDEDDDELTEMAEAVNRILYLTPEGIEMKPAINSFKIKR